MPTLMPSITASIVTALTVTSSTVVAVLNTEVTLSCTYPSSSSTSPTAHWYFGNEELATGITHVTSTKTSTLTISKFTFANMGYYSFLVIWDSKALKSTEFPVYFDKTDESMAESAVGFASEAVTLTCTVYSAPDGVTITWNHEANTTNVYEIDGRYSTKVYFDKESLLTVSELRILYLEVDETPIKYSAVAVWSSSETSAKTVELTVYGEQHMINTHG